MIKELLSATAIALFSLGCHTEPLDVVPDVDLARFQGKWYEIAKLPRPTQAGCAGTTAFYRRTSERELEVVNECQEGRLGGHLRSVTATAKVIDPHAPAKLVLDFGAIYGDYWIIDLGEHYEFAVVGHPTRDYLWIMSRTPQLDDATLRGILDRARTKKFDVSRLDYTQQ